LEFVNFDVTYFQVKKSQQFKLCKKVMPHTAYSSYFAACNALLELDRVVEEGRFGLERPFLAVAFLNGSLKHYPYLEMGRA
jgi:hypothetical protein